MSDALTERVLDLWERGAGLDVNARADLTLEVLGAKERGESPFLYERDGDLLELHRTLFGSSIDGVIRCPACSTDFEMPLDLDVLRSTAPAPEPVRIEMDDFVAFVRPPRSEDLRGLEGDVTGAGETLFARCVVDASRGSASIAPSQLPPAFRAAAAAEISARGMESPSLDMVCGECAHAWRAPLDIGRALLAEIDGWVTRMLGDVHRIAAAYHWNERDIMALPIRRRLYYLDAIG